MRKRLCLAKPVYDMSFKHKENLLFKGREITKKATRIRQIVLLCTLAFAPIATASDIPFGPLYSSWFDSSLANGREIAVDTFATAGWPGEKVHVFYPRQYTQPLPVVFFLHGIGERDPDAYEPLLSHLACRGFAVVHASYTAFPASKSAEYSQDFLNVRNTH